MTPEQMSAEPVSAEPVNARPVSAGPIPSVSMTLWQPLPSTVSAASILLIIDGVLTWISAMVLAAPIVGSRITGSPLLTNASAQAPPVWDLVRPLLLGTMIALVIGSAELWFAYKLRTDGGWPRVAATVAVGLGLLCTLPLPWIELPLPIDNTPFGWVSTFAKPLLWLAALALLWLPLASRDYFAPGTKHVAA